MNETRKSRLTSGVFSSTTDLWATPQAFFDELDAEFHFDLDPCALPENAKCKTFFTPEQDGLKQSWGGAQSLLQSAIRQGHRPVGQEMPRRGTETEHACGHAYSRPHRHVLLSRLYLPSGRTALHPWPSSLQRGGAGRSIPLDGGSV